MTKSTRNPYDYYATPEYCISPMLKKLYLGNLATFLEPCKGGGAIYNKFNTVIDTCHYREIQEGKDYLTWTPKITYDLIVTNPPFSLAQEFLEKSLDEAKVVIYLLRLDFLGSKARSKFWKSHTKHLTHLMVLSKRPSFTNDGRTDSCNYSWFVFDPERLVAGSEEWLVPL